MSSNGQILPNEDDDEHKLLTRHTFKKDPSYDAISNNTNQVGTSDLGRNNISLVDILMTSKACLS